MIECLLEPKTWIFALFSCLDNIPNSLTNQSQLIIQSFGFTTLQTTLLGCVSGSVVLHPICHPVSLPNTRSDYLSLVSSKSSPSTRVSTSLPAGRIASRTSALSTSSPTSLVLYLLWSFPGQTKPVSSPVSTSPVSARQASSLSLHGSTRLQRATQSVSR
jgi:hypothetical protein